jgi:DMSO/TMAO reductase YedYZ heme-binding membrane subunit
MKYLQILSKYLIIFSIVWVPALWFGLQKLDLLWNEFLWASIYQLFFDVSLLAVFFVMIIRPLADIFPHIKAFKKGIILRKSFWIFSAMIILTTLVSNWIQNPDTAFFNYFSSDKWQIWYPIIARISEFTTIILLATSNKFSMRKLGRNWKRIQQLAYAYFFTWGIIAARWNHTEIIYVMMWIVIVLWIWAEGVKYKKKRA